MLHLRSTYNGKNIEPAKRRLKELPGRPKELLRELEKTIETFIPYGDLPFNGWDGWRKVRLGSRTEYWAGADDEKFYGRNPHPDYGPTDITYVYNKYGYRSVEFDIQADIRIASFGCSCVFGTGMPNDKLFSNLIAQRLTSQTGKKVINLNLGIQGASNSAIARTLSLAVEKLKPDLVLVNFTYLIRFEFFTGEGYYFFLPHRKDALAKALSIMANPHDCIIDLYKDYKLIEKTLQSMEIPWFWSAMMPDILLLEEHLALDRFVGTFDTIDTARDHGHPGALSNSLLCDKYMEKINNSGVIT